MKLNYQYRLYPTTEQKLTLNEWLRICLYWYNRQLGERFDWWEQNRSLANSCPLICHLPELKDKPEFYGQKKQLPELKQDLVTVGWSKELLNFNSVPSQTLQEVCTRVKLTFSRYVTGDRNGKRSGKPRIKNTARYRSMVFEGAQANSCSVGGKWLYVSLPKLGIIKLRHHRPLPEGAKLKSAQVIKKADGWYINLRLEDTSVPDFKSDINPTWENSLGMDAVLHEDDYLATSEGVKLPSLKSFRKSQHKLVLVSRRKASKKPGTKPRRKLAKREAKIHQRIARARKDHAYKTAHKLMATGKKVFFHEKLNLAGLSKRNKPKQDETGKYLPNGHVLERIDVATQRRRTPVRAKSGLNKSWLDAAFGQFFKILKYIGEKTGASVIAVNPAYTSMILPYKDEFVFTNVSIRKYWDVEIKLWVDRDIASSINLKRVGLGLFPTIIRRKGNQVVQASTTNSTSKLALSILRGLEKPALYM